MLTSSSKRWVLVRGDGTKTHRPPQWSHAHRIPYNVRSIVSRADSWRPTGRTCRASDWMQPPCNSNVHRHPHYKEIIMQHSNRNPSFAFRLAGAGLVAAGIALLANSAFAGECPAASRVADGKGQAMGPTQPVDVTDVVRATT